MLKKTSDNARHCDVLGVARHTGQQAADAAHDHLDCDACAGCLSQMCIRDRNGGALDDVCEQTVFVCGAYAAGDRAVFGERVLRCV